MLFGLAAAGALAVPAVKAATYILPPPEGWPPLRLQNMRRIADLMGRLWCPNSFEDMKEHMQILRNGETMYLVNPDYVRLYLHPFRGSLGVNISTTVDPDLEAFRQELEESRDWHRRYALRYLEPEARERILAQEKVRTARG